MGSEMCIRDSPKAQKNAKVDLADAESGWNAHIGSRLIIDNLKLGY